MSDLDKSIGDEKTVVPEKSGAHRYAFSPGETLGSYKIIKALGAGGMGEVYLVEQVYMHKRYALKVLPRALFNNPQFVDRFRIEARVMADLQHPHIVQVHHMDEQNGVYYLTMDYVAGPDGNPKTLDDLMKRSGGKLDEALVERIMRQTCEALAYAHSFRGEGVVHRDLKPSNILLEGGGESSKSKAQSLTPFSVRIADFGLAKVVGSDYLQSVIERSISLSLARPVERSIGDEKTVAAGGDGGSDDEGTSTRSILGTFEYMSPEQKRGEAVDARSDLYALGIMLYAMLTGRKPEGRWKLPSQLGCSKGWDDVVERCLEPDADDRFQSAEEMKAALPEIDLTTATEKNEESAMLAPPQALGRAEEDAARAENTPPKKKSGKKWWIAVVVLFGAMLIGATYRSYKVSISHPKQQVKASQIKKEQCEDAAQVEQKSSDSRGQVFDRNGQKMTLNIESHSGGTVYLTLDQQIQSFVEIALDNLTAKYHPRAAWGVVQNLRTGEILAMASVPKFDLKNNPAINYTYEPGSTLKAMIIASALDCGAVRATDIFDCENGAWSYGGNIFHDSHPQGMLTVADIIQKSSNIGAAKVALQMGEGKVYQSLRGFGFSEKTGIDLPDENAGVVWGTNRWSKLSIPRIAMGHEILTTSMQILNAASAIANRGVLMRPKIVSKVINAAGGTNSVFQPEVIRHPIREDTAKDMCFLLERITRPSGTAANAAVENYRVGGITGTAQKANKEQGGYYNDKYISSFVGFLPSDNPSISIIVVADDPQDIYYGGTVCAPYFREIADQTARYLRIPTNGNERAADRQTGLAADLSASAQSPAVPIQQTKPLSLPIEGQKLVSEKPIAARLTNDVVVRVNEVPITHGEIMQGVKMNLSQKSKTVTSQQLTEMTPQIYQNVLDTLIANILLTTAAQRSSLSVSDIELAKEIATIESKAPEGKTLKEALTENKINYAEWKEDLRKQILVRKLVEGKTADVIVASSAEIAKYYAENADSFKVPETVTASHILVAFTREENATAKAQKKTYIQRMRENLLAGSDFATIAREKSDCPSSKQGGNLGTFARGQMVPEFESVAFALPIGQVSDVVETQFGYHLIKVTAHQQASVRPLSQVKDQLQEYLTGKKKQEALLAYIEELKKKANIKYQ